MNTGKFKTVLTIEVIERNAEYTDKIVTITQTEKYYSKEYLLSKMVSIKDVFSIASYQLCPNNIVYRVDSKGNESVYAGLNLTVNRLPDGYFELLESEGWTEEE